MARLLPLIFAFTLSAWSVASDEAIAAYRALQRRIEETRRNASRLTDAESALTQLVVQRDSLDAQFPFRPRESPVLAAERKKTDQEIQSLTRQLQTVRQTSSSPRAPAPRKKPPVRRRP